MQTQQIHNWLEIQTWTNVGVTESGTNILIEHSFLVFVTFEINVLKMFSKWKKQLYHTFRFYFEAENL